MDNLPYVPAILEGDSVAGLDYTIQPTPLVTSFPEDDDEEFDAKKLYLVPYWWWKETRYNDENMKGILYSALLNDDSEMQIQLDLEREFSPCVEVEDEEEGFPREELAFVEEAMWLRALKWYHDSIALDNAVNPVFLKHNTADVFPLVIRLSVSSTKSLVVNIRLRDNGYDYYENAFNIFAAQNDPLYIWDFSGQMALLTDNANTFSNSSGRDSEEVLLELEVHGLTSSAIEGAGGDTGMIANDSTTEGNSCSSSTRLNGGDHDVHSASGNTVYPDSWNSYVMSSYIGQKGLYNLGNTCFMNSAIQCLVHTPKLVDYFLGDFQNEINDVNPLGMKGELALAFGDLLRKIWAPGTEAIAPTAFKWKLTKFAPQFSGYNQHDSQEFLAFLLDGLHEDLNRVKKKPYIENKDPENQLDQEVADEKWKNYLTRDDSIIVDLFQGQFRSNLVCPVCRKVSVTFDPFMYWTIPLPSTRMRSMAINVVGANGRPSSITVSVPKSGTVKDLIQALNTEYSVGSDETLLVAEVNDHQIFRYLDVPSVMLGLIRDDSQIVAYRLPKESETSLIVEFMHRRAVRKSTFIRTRIKSRGFGFPLVGRFSCLSYGSDLRKAFLNLVSPFLSQSEVEPKENDNSQSQDPVNVDSYMESASVACDVDPEPETEDDSYSSNTFQFSDSELAFSAVKMHEPLKKTGPRLKFVVSWPEKMVEKYDMHLFNSLPEISYRQINPEESVHLHKCLEAFLMEEPLGPDDMWYCPVCKMNQQAIKKLDLWRLPEILVIHLKRFSFNGIYKSKLETLVDFPFDDLDLSSYTAQSESDLHSSCRYTLYGIINHHGGMGSGHYTAYVQHGHDKWYNFDDRHVLPIDRYKLKTSAAYVLLYRRVAKS